MAAVWKGAVIAESDATPGVLKKEQMIRRWIKFLEFLVLKPLVEAK